MAHTHAELAARAAQQKTAIVLNENLPRIAHALERIAMAVEISQGYNHSPKEETDEG